MKKEKLIPFVLPIFCIVLGVLAFITADRALQVICYIASGALILIGIVCVIRYLTGTPEENFPSNGFLFGVVSNSRSIAGMDNFVGNNVVLDDGLLEGLFIKKPQTMLELEQMKKGLIDHNLEAPCLYHIQAEKIIVRSEPTAWTLDGESGGIQKEVVICVRKQALVIALPFRSLPMNI